MATNFSSSGYIAALQTLLNRHGVGVTVRGFRPGRQYDDLDTPVAELMIDDSPAFPTGQTRAIDVVLNGALLVMRRLNEDEAEERALELAIDVMTALIDEASDDSPPVLGAGPIIVKGIAPEQPDGVLRNRVCGWLVSFEQQWRFTRTNQPTEPEPLTDLWAAMGPDLGPGATYTRLVPKANAGDTTVPTDEEE